MKWVVAGCLALLMGAAPLAAKEPKAMDLFGAMRTAKAGSAQVIGTYAKGCAAGLVQLPETGPTWQAMRLSRNRNWGHPVLVQYLEDLSAKAKAIGWAGLYVGDMSQPRGGPTRSGHLSHQTGLDVDIWYTPVQRLDLSAAAREKLSAIDVRTKDMRNVNANWTRAHMALLKAAASDPRVDRIFVTPPAKIAMCAAAGSGDRAWLQKIRPLYGHNDHFHVRLKCPAGSPQCEVQKPSVATLSNGGDGCDASLTWWVTTYLEPPKNPVKKPEKRARGPRDYTLADLPKTCTAVLQD